jgi:hypothetical protein
VSISFQGGTQEEEKSLCFRVEWTRSVWEEFRIPHSRSIRRRSVVVKP